MSSLPLLASKMKSPEADDRSAYAAAVELDIYEILTVEFGDSAADTIVYSYLFRLGESPNTGMCLLSYSLSSAGIVEKHLGGTGTGSSSPTPAIEKPTRTTSPGVAPARSPVQPQEAKAESEAERLVRGLTGGDQKEVSPCTQFPW